MSSPTLIEGQGLRVAVEGCGHGTLDAIYASVNKACDVRHWNGVDVLIIGGDFQAVRNASDLTVMSCPVKYREIGDFYKYYNGSKMAPCLTIFVGGNHEASSHLWELFYGGWVAPNIYYMGAANVVRVGGVRIAGMSGIWKGYNYNKHHHERLPYSADDVKSFYHVREIDVRKLLQLRSQVDIGISHDWPRAIERHGNEKALFRAKPFFEEESQDGTLGNPAAGYVMDRLRPPYWFSAHMHVKFSATKVYEKRPNLGVEAPKPSSGTAPFVTTEMRAIEPSNPSSDVRNTDEIELDMDDDEDTTALPPAPNGAMNKDEISLDDEDGQEESKPTLSPASSFVPQDIRAQLPAAFSRPAPPQQRATPGQPSPPEVMNDTVRFLALDKCLPGRKFLQLLEVSPYQKNQNTIPTPQLPDKPKPKFEYDPEWLAITRVFAPEIVLGDKSAPRSQDLGESHYRPLIEKELAWVEENVVKKSKLEIPENFVLTAPIFHEGMPEIIHEGPVEYSNPQMQEFCDLIGIENKFFATNEEREERMKSGPADVEERRDGGFGRGSGRGGRGSGGGGWNRGRGGGFGRGRGRGRGRGGHP